MQSNGNHGITILIILAVVLILAVRFFLSNRDVVTEDDVTTKIERAVQATQTAQANAPTPMPTNATPVAVDALRMNLTAEVFIATIDAQSTHIASLLATSDAQWAVTPTPQPTMPAASDALRAQRTAESLMVTVDAQAALIADLKATVAQSAAQPTETPTPTVKVTWVAPTEVQTFTPEH